MMDEDQKREKRVLEVVRLTEEQYKLVEKKVSGISVGTTTTPIEVAYQLGIQQVLKVLREGVVVK